MKKIVFSMLIICLIQVNIVLAQVGSATIHLQEGALDKAKIAIDNACTKPNTISKAKTWFVKGQIYAEIANAKPNNPHFQLDKNAVQVAYNAYQKALELDYKKKAVYNDSKQGVKRLVDIAQYHAVNSYNKKDKDQALIDLKTAHKIDQNDTTVLRFAAIISYSDNNIDDYIFFIEKYLANEDVPYKNKIKHYINTSSIYKEEKKDLASAIKIIEQAHNQDSNNKPMYLLLKKLYDENKELGKSSSKEGYANDSNF